MNTRVITLKRQPAVVNDVIIVTRKLHLYSTEASVNAELVPTLVPDTDEYLCDVTWEEITSPVNSSDFKVLQLQFIARVHQMSDPDQLVAHLQNPPRIYPVA